MLAEQHLHLGQARQEFVGVICTDLRLSDALDHAIQQARQVCIYISCQVSDPNTSSSYVSSLDSLVAVGNACRYRLR